MSSFPARDIAARYSANPKKGMRKLGDTPIPKYPSIHSNRSERTREAVVSHFTANPAAASSVLGLRNNSAYNAQHRKDMKLKFLETSCPLHLPGSAPYLPVVKRAPPPLLRAGQTSAPAQPGSSIAEGGDASPATGLLHSSDAAKRPAVAAGAAAWRERFEAERERGAMLLATESEAALAPPMASVTRSQQARGQECAIPHLSEYQNERNRTLDRSAYDHTLRQTYGNDWKRFTAQQRIDVPTAAARQGASEARLLIDRVDHMKVIQKRTYVHLPSYGPV